MIGLCANIAFLLSTLLYPYMPNVSASIRRQLNLPAFSVLTDKPEYSSENIISDSYEFPVFYNKFFRFLTPGHKIGTILPLFKRIGDADVKTWREKFGGQQQQQAAKPEDAKKAGKAKTPKAPKDKNTAPAAASATAPVEQSKTDAAAASNSTAAQ